MRKLIFNNFGLKVLALVIAIVVWLLVVNVNDPVITRTITGVPVNVINANYVESQGLSSKLDDSSETVSVTIVGNRSDVERIGKENIEVTADLTQIVSMEADPIMVPVTAEVNGINSANVSTNPSNVQVALEPMKSDSFIVMATAGDTKPAAKDVEVGTLTPETETITMTGPESLMNIIERVVAQVDVSRLTSDSDVSATVKVFDKNGAEFSDAALNNLKFLNSDGTVLVHVDLWDVVNSVGLEVVPKGEPASGFRVDNIATTPEVISLSADDAAVKALEEAGNRIVIEGDDVDISGLESDYSGRIDINEYLPENTKLSENVSSTVLIDIDIEPMGSVNFEVPTKDIIQTNLAPGLGVIYNVETIKVSVQGAEEELAKLDASKLKTTIDFSGMVTEGPYEDVPVKVTLPENCWLVGSDGVSLELFKENTETAPAAAGEINEN